MRKTIKTLLILLDVIAVLFTAWYSHFGKLTENSGAFSTIGLQHPIYFIFWGVLIFFGIYANLLFAYNYFLPKCKFQYYLFSISAIGMALTLFCKFDYTNKLQYYLHCIGSLSFSAVTGVCVFVFFLLCFKKGFWFKAATFSVAIILISDLIFLIIFKENALIEGIPILFALIILPITNFTNLFKEKEYATR